MKIGIVCDNYKLDKYKKELTNKGFKFSTGAFTYDTTTIQVEAEEENLKEIESLCKKLEFEFKNSN